MKLFAVVDFADLEKVKSNFSKHNKNQKFGTYFFFGLQLIFYELLKLSNLGKKKICPHLYYYK